jgi:hypothetical protein
MSRWCHMLFPRARAGLINRPRHAGERLKRESRDMVIFRALTSLNLT